MAQAAFVFDRPLSPTPTGAATAFVGAANDAAGDVVGFAIGWDHAQRGLTPPLAHLHSAGPVRQGWQAARSVFGTRTMTSGDAVQQWLALRLQAWTEGVAFEPVQVTPRLLARLGAGADAVCPVSRLPLAGAAGRVCRLNTHAAYAAGNLARLHRDVVKARATLDLDALLPLAQRIDDGAAHAPRGLDAPAWTRLAVLVSLVTPLPHARAACVPLRVLPPNRLRVVNPIQALQVALTLQFSVAGYARRLLGWAALLPDNDVRQSFQIFMHTLLARRLAAGANADAQALRQALEDSWANALVNRRWQRLALRLSAAQCEQWLKRAAARGLLVAGSRWLSAEAATDGWCVDDNALATAETGPRSTNQSAPEPGAENVRRAASGAAERSLHDPVTAHWPSRRGPSAVAGRGSRRISIAPINGAAAATSSLPCASAAHV